MQSLLNHKYTQLIINFLILFNAVVLGLMTRNDITSEQLARLELCDSICLVVFCVEILLRILTERKKFFDDGWNCFDFTIISVTLISSMGVFSVGRALRVFKILKAISSFPSLRIVTLTVLKSLSEMGSIMSFLFVVFYVFAIMGNQLFGKEFTVFFGNFSSSMFTLFQIMTLDAWSDQIARPMLEVYPYAWIYFLSFIFLTTIIILNVVIGLVVETVNHVTQYDRLKNFEKHLNDDDELLHEITKLQIHLANITKIINDRKNAK